MTPIEHAKLDLSVTCLRVDPVTLQRQVVIAYSGVLHSSVYRTSDVEVSRFFHVDRNYTKQELSNFFERSTVQEPVFYPSRLAQPNSLAFTISSVKPSAPSLISMTCRYKSRSAL